MLVKMTRLQNELAELPIEAYTTSSYVATNPYKDAEVTVLLTITSNVAYLNKTGKSSPVHVLRIPQRRWFRK